MSSNVILIGFMGAGKTEVGKRLAGVFGLRFVDLDDMIEAREGKKITDIFAEKGEAYFRSVEKEAVKEAAATADLVIACGGGAVVDKENMAALKESGVMVYLKASPEIIFERTRHCSHRPLLNVVDPKKKIEELLAGRAPYYEQADVIIDTTRLTLDEVVEYMVSLLKAQRRE